jgi:N-formylglutamate deformylase
MDTTTPFVIKRPVSGRIPIIVSVPHCGISFPDELKDHFRSDMMKAPDDTDWYVHDLYNFLLEEGVTIIHAKYSRWVIDLNRDPESKPLYDDGRIITALTPTTDFFGNSIYKSTDLEPNEQEVQRRIKNYYTPYYEKISDLLNETKQEFGKALLWDAHSIRHFVPTIRKEAFPDMILGNNDEKTASQNLIKVALKGLNSGDYQINHNSPFKGGHITRSFGAPEENVHALQLEMNKILYMDDEEKIYDKERAAKVQEVLKHTFNLLKAEL